MAEKIKEELMEKLAGMFDVLSEEQAEKAGKCQSWEELMDFAEKEGLELPEKILSMAAGGWKDLPPYPGREAFEAARAEYYRKKGLQKGFLR
ncbi:MAG: hypothetical protein K6A90_04760 [Lachnospiraceae bacterium]|nr:hypothetical protein [Lachnospiraceae bacterium]